MRGTVIRRGLLVLGIVVVLIIVAFGPQLVSSFTKKNPTPALTTVSYRSFPVDVTATGTLLPQSLTVVNFGANGQVAQINVAVGDHVTTGEVLAKLNDANQLAGLHAAQASLSSAQTALSAAEASHSATAIAAAQARVANAQAAVQRAQANENRTVIAAPSAATVLEVNAQVGSTVTAGRTGSPAVVGSSGTIINPNSVSRTKAFMLLGNAGNYQVVAAFSQSDIPEMQAGQTGTVSFDAFPGLSFNCHVVAVASGATLVHGVPQFFAAIAPDRTDPRLRTGMTANVIINVAQANNVLAVPSQAIYVLNNASYVSVWQQGNAVPTRVVTGLVGDQLTEIVSGVSNGEQLVVSAQQPLPSLAPGVGPSPSP